MKRLIPLAGLALSGCISMTPATYLVSQDSKVVLEKFQGAKVVVDGIAAPPTFDPMCRAVGKVQPADGVSLGEFVAKGFNDELKYAGLHGDSGVRLRGALTKAVFSSSAGVTGGYWDLGLALESSNRASMAIEHKYEFEAGFVGASACNNTSRALGPAVQQLVHKVITDPRFGALLR